MIAGLIAQAAAVLGCGPPRPAAIDVDDESIDAPTIRPVGFRDGSPEQLLAATLSRYHNAASYRDDGRATLTYQVGQDWQNRQAPMNVWFDRNELYIETYDVRLTSDPQSVTAWIADPITDNFDSQVLKSPPIAGRPTSEQLLADSIVSTRIAAGLAGPPPQLEWLFAAEPMKRLFAGGHRFGFGATRSIQGRQCRSVTVDANDDATGHQHYEFLIDGSDGVIRQVQLPTIVAPVRPSSPPQPIAISIDFVDATFAPPTAAPSVDRLPALPKYVRRMVALPPRRPARILGAMPKPFSIDDATRQLQLTANGIDRPVTVIVRLSSDPATLAAVAAAHAIADQMPPQVTERVRVAILADRDAIKLNAEEVRVPVFVDGDGRAAAALEMEPGAAVILDRRGIVAWVENELTVVTAPPLAAILADVITGVDVPERLRDQWTEQMAKYDRELAQAMLRR
jgi:hypothetical protein